jgi:hypothetical protein
MQLEKYPTAEKCIKQVLTQIDAALDSELALAGSEKVT